MTKTESDKARNLRRNETLVQSRVPIPVRCLLLREAARKRVSVSALLASIIAAHFGVDSD